MECLRNNFNAGVVLGGRYQTISPLNHGSFGMVFLGKDIKTGKTVAIKCLTKRAAANDAGFEFAIDDKSEELVLHRRLGQHRNIVNLTDSFETDAHVYLVLEFCEQGDLYEAIRMGHGPLETEHVRRFMLELVDAVSYMHSKGVYHRDIKPENIFLTQSGSMKLGDFGLATTEHWTMETAVGSDRYMSPEQYESDGAGYSPAQADIWAIGICLLNILFARNPFNTPSESDKFFLDFSRDKQSLFDVFPSMSQDTYEVIVECMNLDPNRRSLIGARRALLRAVSFTTADETLDDFCSADAVVVASTNREPLRTPSIQSPHVDNGAFPWAKALQVSTLSDIADEENWSEDLFSKSATTADWMSADAQTPSMSSVLESNFATSMNSLNMGPLRIPTKATKVSPMAGSLPISMAKPRLQSAMSMVFGRKETVSKSWSDMWDEDVEEEEHSRQLEALKEMNSRTWSHESHTAVLDKDNDDTPRAGLSPATKSATMSTLHDIPSIDSTLTAKDIDEDLGADGFFFHDAPPSSDHLPAGARYSPPPKRGNVDKWAALGERRRAYTGTSSSKAVGTTLKTTGFVGAGLTSSGSAGNDYGVSGIFDTAAKTSPYSFFNFNKSPSNNNPTTPQKWNLSSNGIGKDRIKECPRSKGRERDWNWNFDWRKEKRHAFGDEFKWVGGWQETHS